jgi:uncharacterized protein YbaA (DUF1428 family)
MPYVDGFIVPVKKSQLEAYKAAARLGRDVWMELGAIGYLEAVGDDVPYGEVTSFPRSVQATEDEVVVFSWILYKDKASREEIMPKVMADPRLKATMENPPFDAGRMIYGGFQSIVEG